MCRHTIAADAEDHDPHGDTGILCPPEHAFQESRESQPRAQNLHFSGEALIREAVAAAMKQVALSPTSACSFVPAALFLAPACGALPGCPEALDALRCSKHGWRGGWMLGRRQT